MKDPKARLAQFAQRITKKPKEEITELRKGVILDLRKNETVEANPPRGERGNFLKVTITLSPKLYELINQEITQRRIAQEKGATLSNLVREALVEFFAKREKG